MVGAANLVGNYLMNREFGIKARQAEGNRAEGLSHTFGINHGQGRNTRQFGQVAAAGAAIKQAHGTLHQNQVRALGGLGQPPPTLVLAGHPGVQLVNRVTGGYLQHHGVQVIRPVFEHPDVTAGVPVQSGQGGGDHGLALAGAGGGDHGRWDLIFHHSNQLHKFGDRWRGVPPGTVKTGMFLSSVQGRIYSVSREAHPATGCCTRLEVRFVSAQKKARHPLPPLPVAGCTNVPERSAPASFLPGPSKLRHWGTSAEYDHTSGQPDSDHAGT